MAIWLKLVGATELSDMQEPGGRDLSQSVSPCEL
jgi:hypothetical protein